MSDFYKLTLPGTQALLLLDNEGDSVLFLKENLENKVIDFNEAVTRNNIAGTGEDIKTIFGKIKKYLTDLNPVAFSGSHNDLVDNPDVYLKSETYNKIEADNLLLNKVDKDGDKVLSDNNYTDEHKTAVETIPDKANTIDVNVALGLKVSTASIINDLTTGGETVPSSAETVKILKGLIDVLGTDMVTALLLKANQETTYTKDEVDNIITQLETDIDWKEPVATFADLYTTYPNAVAGWVANVLEGEGITYRFNGTIWKYHSANGIPKATELLDGLMSKESYSKLGGIETQANKYVLPPATSSTLGGVKTGNTLSNNNGYINFVKENWAFIEENGTLIKNTNNQTFVTSTVSLPTPTTLGDKIVVTSCRGADGAGQSFYVTGTVYTPVGIVTTGRINFTFSNENNPIGAIEFATGKLGENTYYWYVKNVFGNFTVRLTSSGEDIPLRNISNEVQVALDQKQNIEIMSELTGATPTIASLTDNTKYYCSSTVTALSITSIAVFTIGSMCSLSFLTGASIDPTNLNNLGIKWKGDDCISTTFSPKVNENYTIVFEHNGIDVVGIVGAY